MLIREKHLWFPVVKNGEERYLEVFSDNNKIHEFKIPYIEGREADYFASIPMSEYIGKEVSFSGDFSEEYFETIRNEDKPSHNYEERPAIHFTAEYGWINDPNGLVYDGENYHLYFQYNPFHIIWRNMLWGHAKSRDLIHWEYQDSVLFPDENGMMFSGNGIRNERSLLGLGNDALIFFYTAAGATPWSKDKLPVQKMAVSTDRGKTLKKLPEVCVDVITKDTRDPMVFWHEESKAYIMTLYIDANDFGIFRSDDLINWTQTQRFTLKDAWECPGLMQFDSENGKIWLFISADGFYYLGTFDGYEYKTDGVKHYAYANKVPYAGQCYSGVQNRTIYVPWFRLDGNGINYNGCMGVPRELSLVSKKGSYVLRLQVVEEIIGHLKKTDTIPDKGPYMLEIRVGKDEWTLQIGDSKIKYLPESRCIMVDQSQYDILTDSEKVSLLVDYNILEITQAEDISLGAYLLKGNTNNIVGTDMEVRNMCIYRYL